ncbi:hypothetical protein NDU88_004246 [Pleurodeles waltl]|uniref:Uncharacterized protein n=1 Tax=Pleurodeles waltl TaxID=8319 RepID=A0AAV7T798_PLEWA|nr:hypothetical protein NDU88_004246 [Pleurodeles waltl]
MKKGVGPDDGAVDDGVVINGGAIIFSGAVSVDSNASYDVNNEDIIEVHDKAVVIVYAEEAFISIVVVDSVLVDSSFNDVCLMNKGSVDAY